MFVAIVSLSFPSAAILIACSRLLLGRIARTLGPSRVCLQQGVVGNYLRLAFDQAKNRTGRKKEVYPRSVLLEKTFISQNLLQGKKWIV